MKNLSEVVRRLRIAAGHRSARAFHRSWARTGGACSLRAYCAIEADRLTPCPELATRLAAVLSVRPGTRRAGEFLKAYLTSVTRLPDLAESLFESLAAPLKAEDISRRLLRAGLAQGRHVLTPGQQRAVVESDAVRLGFIVIHATSRPWTVAALSSVLGLSAADVRVALARLVKVRLVRNSRDGYWSPLSHLNVVFPRPTPAEIGKIKENFFACFPEGSWSRQGVVLFRARHADARRIAREMGREATSARALHRGAGPGDLFAVGAFVRRVS